MCEKLNTSAYLHQVVRVINVKLSKMMEGLQFFFSVTILNKNRKDQIWKKCDWSKTWFHDNTLRETDGRPYDTRSLQDQTKR